MPNDLTPPDVRVLGSLIEKELATPDYYPLSLNALTLACNQSSNRAPVMALSEAEVTDAITTLRRRSLVRSFQSSGSRVPKYQHLCEETLGLTIPERAVLCVILLRGPQTMGELHARADRLIPAADSAALDAALDSLAARTPDALVTLLPRRPGQKEGRYTHLLSGEVLHDTGEVESPPTPGTDSRVHALENAVAALQSEVTTLRAELESFRSQFS